MVALPRFVSRSARSGRFFLVVFFRPCLSLPSCIFSLRWGNSIAGNLAAMAWPLQAFHLCRCPSPVSMNLALMMVVFVVRRWGHQPPWHSAHPIARRPVLTSLRRREPGSGQRRLLNESGLNRLIVGERERGEREKEGGGRRTGKGGPGALSMLFSDRTFPEAKTTRAQAKTKNKNGQQLVLFTQERESLRERTWGGQLARTDARQRSSQRGRPTWNLELNPKVATVEATPTNPGSDETALAFRCCERLLSPTCRRSGSKRLVPPAASPPPCWCFLCAGFSWP